MSNTMKCNQKLITDDLFIADTFFNRFLGYMFRKKPHYEAIMLSPCNSIHTYFMQFPLDIIVLNKNLEVIKKIGNMKPGKIIKPIQGAHCIVEAKAGKLQFIQIGDRIDLIEYD